MGQVALGLAGAAVGAFVGGPVGAQIGWMLGSMAWNLLDPPKVYGPRLNDTKVRGADYGVMRPILYGTMRVGGIGMGQGSMSAGPNQFTENEESSGGKGGSEQVSYRYNLSFMNEICEGPIIGVLRRWANGRLVTEAGAASSDIWPYTLYLGDTTQTPDPTMETIYGAGDVCPMRGVAYEVVTELALQDYGNARPNVEYEAYASAGTFPRRISTFNLGPDGAGIDCVTYSDGNVTIAGYTAIHYYERTFDLAGVEDGGAAYDALLVPSASVIYPVSNLPVASDWIGWYSREILTTSFTANPGGGPVANSANGSAIYKAGNIYAIGYNSISQHVHCARWPCTGGVVSAETGTSDAYHDFGDCNNQSASFVVGSSNNDFIYVTDFFNSPATLNEFDLNLTLVRTWDLDAEYAISNIINGRPFTVYQQATALVLACDRGTAGEKQLFCFYLNDDLTVTQVAGINTDPAGGSSMGPIIELGTTGYVTVADGIATLDPTAGNAVLGDIVSDLLQRAGLTTAQIDVTDLTQEVEGFLVASQMTVRNAIDMLRKAYFFDLTEYDGKIVCRNRGHDATDTIPDGDLAAHEPGSEPPEPLEVTRIPEQELPRTVSINFYDRDHDYQTGSVYWRRTVTLSESDVTLDLPLNFSATQALLRAQWHMHFAWLERDRFTFYTTRKWAKLTPTDVVVVRGVNIRITSRTESPNGIIRFEGVRAFAGPYSSPITDPGGSGAPGGEVPGSPPGGQPPQNPPSTKADTAAILIDGPWTSESVSPSSLKAAIYKSSTGAWPGAALYKSVDGGTTYASVASTSAAATVGTVATALGNFTGGNIVDESNSITVLLSSGTLESTTEDGLLAGLHLIALGSVANGWEFLQYRTATLVSTNRYTLTGLLRGRFGTEWAMSTHGANEILVLISTCVEVPGSFSEINALRKYKAVTFGTALADATAQNFTNTGVAYKPLAPVLLGGGRDASGELTLNWTPRRRGSGGWPDGVDLPATESDNWQVEIFTDNTYATEVRAFGITSPTVTYTAALQTTDFGSPQATVYWRVAQIGTAGLGYFTEATT